MAIQKNNGSPMGYGQPRRNMRQVVMDEGAEEMMQQMPDQGTGQPQISPNPSLYGQLPQGGQPQYPPRQYPQNGGFNPQSRQPQGPPQQGGQQTQRVPGVPQSQDQSIYPGGPQGQYQGGALGGQRNRGFNPQNRGAMGDIAGQMGLGQQAPQAGGIGQAVSQSIANGYTDIAGMRDVFKPGEYMGQLSGFNTQGWGSGERGSDTLKNMMGTIFSNYDVTQPGALQQVLNDPKLREALPNASIVEHPNQDLFDPDGPNGPMQPVDVIGKAVAGGSGQNWAWQPQEQSMGMGNQMMQGPGGPAQQAYMMGMPGGQTDYLSQDPTMAGAPEVVDESSAMQLLQYLMAQQQAGTFNQPPQQQYIP